MAVSCASLMTFACWAGRLLVIKGLSRSSGKCQCRRPRTSLFWVSQRSHSAIISPFFSLKLVQGVDSVHVCSQQMWHLHRGNGFLVLFLPSTFSPTRPCFPLLVYCLSCGRKMISFLARVFCALSPWKFFSISLHLTLLTRLHSFASTVLITVLLKLIQTAVDIPPDIRVLFIVPVCCLVCRSDPPTIYSFWLLSRLLGSGRHFSFISLFIYICIYMYIFVPFSHIIVCFLWWKCLLGWLLGSRRAKHTLGVGKAAQNVKSGWG